MSRLVKSKGPKFWRGPQATKKKSLRPTSILWLCHQTEPHFRHSLPRLEVHCGVPAALEGKATTTCQLLSCLEPGTRQTLRRTAWNTPGCLQSGARFRDATFTGGEGAGGGDLALPSPRGATPLGATATPSTNRKRRRSQCSSEVTPRVVTAKLTGESRRIRRAFTASSGPLAEDSELNSAQLSSARWTWCSVTVEPRTLMPCRVLRWGNGSPSRCVHVLPENGATIWKSHLVRRRFVVRFRARGLS